MRYVGNVLRIASLTDNVALQHRKRSVVTHASLCTEKTNRPKFEFNFFSYMSPVMCHMSLIKAASKEIQ